MYRWCCRDLKGPVHLPESENTEDPACQCGPWGRHCGSGVPGAQPDSCGTWDKSLNLSEPAPCPGWASESPEELCGSWTLPPSDLLNPGHGGRPPAVSMSAKLLRDSESHSGYRLPITSLTTFSNCPGVPSPPSDRGPAQSQGIFIYQPSWSIFSVGLVSESQPGRLKCFWV